MNPFESNVDVTSQSVVLNLAPLENEAAWSRAYVVSTDEEVGLAAPVVILIPRPATDIRAVQMIDGEWRSVQVEGDATSASIQITHFSEVVTVVSNPIKVLSVEIPAIAPGDTPADFLTACLQTVGYIAGAFDRSLTSQAVETNASKAARSTALDWTLSICTNALIRRSSPDGVYVSTECVGDQIVKDDTVDFQTAVNSCAESNNEAPPTETTIAASSADNGNIDGPILAAKFARFEYESTRRMVEIFENQLLVDLSGPTPVIEGVFHWSFDQPEGFGGEICTPEERFTVDSVGLTDVVQSGTTWSGTIHLNYETLAGTCSPEAVTSYFDLGSQEGPADLMFTVDSSNVSGTLAGLDFSTAQG